MKELIAQQRFYYREGYFTFSDRKAVLCNIVCCDILFKYPPYKYLALLKKMSVYIDFVWNNHN